MKIILIMLCLMLLGCSKMYIGGMGYPYNDDKALERITEQLSRNIDFAMLSPPKNETDRDKYITSQLILNDIKYYQSISNLTNMQTSIYTGSELLSLSTGLAATLFTPVTTKTILAAVTTTIIGYRGAIDENVFHQESANVLISVMNSERKRIFLKIMENKKQKVNVYTFDLARKELDEYALAGDPGRAFTVLGEKIKKDDTDTDERIDALVNPKKNDCKTSTISKGVYITNCI
ncbi:MULTISPECIES: hypothetical protein [Lelliottia]|uniref:Lipoprotein n=1 Tax=Lelliottia wanjuensis TaxID=3050585 RepID=A0AAP4CZK9_9ENTR|nr:MULTISPECIES: hypothetical protein [unclassified Lelliottia]MDK9362441.1 hypothetical protein [Lelliottia sp. V106_12]MDK9585290.1 hypothetical protein [Lelliottia sp. V86_10]MDK9616236.1 hypothetical protein [Lelliottia sp. V106_9]